MSSLCFAIVYVFMFAHGFHANHDKRPTQLQRAQWMRVTDFGMVVVTSMMLVRDIHVWDWSAVFDPAVASVMPDVALLQALYRQSSPKDAIVALAMSAYVVTKLGAHKRLKADQPTRSDKVHRIQHFEFSEDHLRPISDALPSNVQWLDIGSGHGTQLNELLETMFETEIKRLAAATAAAKGQSSPPLAITTPFPRSVMLLDRDKDALDRAVTPAWWPEVSRREQRRLGMRSPEAVQVLQTCRVAHMSHVAYEPIVVRSAVHVLKHATVGTFLLVRFTSETTFYRVISTLTACAPLRPYIHHHMHSLLLSDLKRHGWKHEQSLLMVRKCSIKTPDDVTTTVDWCDAQYGEFSGDIIERYLTGLREDGAADVLNCDRLILLKKVK